MKVLLVGSGGREHALAWKLASEADVVAAPGNPGIAQVARCLSIPAADLAGLVELARHERADLVVVGPEDPLIAGLADELRGAGFRVFGPGKDGAQLEGSKAFSKEMMRDAGIPTAEFETFTDSELAKEYARGRFAAGRQVVVKASGAALGKGVIVCSSADEAVEAIEDMMNERAFGAAGETVVVEDRLNGPEFSLLTLCSDEDFYSLPVAQDYKRALDGDRGPNTGGMGSYSPVPWVTEDLVRQTEEEIVRPMLGALRKRGISYRGVLFTGVMVEEGKPYCLEFNVRFGDPETQTVMRRLGDGFLDALIACAEGKPIPRPQILEQAAVSVVVACGGYPGSYAKGKVVALPRTDPSVLIFHAGTTNEDGQLLTNGGRVFAVSATGAVVAEARARAYETADAIEFEGKAMRRDIALISG